MGKQELRENILLQRRNVTVVQRALSSRTCCLSLINNSRIQLAHGVVVYSAFDNEIILDEFIYWAFLNSKRVFLPCFRNGTYCLAEIYSLADLVVGKFGILEPPLDAVILSDEERIAVEVWLVPGVAFTKEGHRLGYGKGVYDRLMLGVKGYKMGVCYPFQLVSDLPVEAHDICMDVLVL